MPSQVVTSHTTAVSVAAVRKNARWAVKSITIENILGGGDRIIKVVDAFTTSKTNGQDPTARTIDRWRTTAPMGFIETYSEQDLKGVRCIGALTIEGESAIDTGCHISVGYEAE